MGRVLSRMARVGLAFGASMLEVACSSGAISVGDNRVPQHTFQDLCLFANAVLVEDATDVDTQVSQQVLASVQTACGAPLTIRVVSQSDPGILATDGRPLWRPSELGMLSGGPTIHDAVRYLDTNVTPVYVEQSGPDYVWAERRTNTMVLSVQLNAFTTTHDVGIVQVVDEPIGGTLSLNVYGHAIGGTQAAAYYFTTMILGNLKNNLGRYYVIEWSDQDGDEVPTAGDLYQLRASG
jgi:hypothetical protein